MKRFNEKSANTNLYARILEARMSASERETAINSLRKADAIVDGVVWVVNGVKRVIASIFEKPAGLKHSH